MNGDEEEALLLLVVVAGGGSGIATHICLRLACLEKKSCGVI